MAERRALHDHSAHILRCIHTMARNLLRLWHHINGRLQKSLRDVTLAYQVSSRATEALWEPLRQWMGRVHMGLHDLEMWERRHDGGHVEYRIHELYLQSCRYTWRRWRWRYTAGRQIVDAEVLRAHDTRVKRLYDEAVARVVARYTYDAHDCCLTLTGTPSGME